MIEATGTENAAYFSYPSNIFVEYNL